MNPTIKSQLHLGASMYVPTTREVRNLVEIASGEKYPELRSVIFCTEDAVREDELNAAMENLKQALRKFPEGGDQRPMRFIRVRSPHVLGRCLGFKGIEKVDGFVLPKVTARTLPSYLGELADASRFSLMPTLETCEVFDPKKRAGLRDILMEEKVKPRILCLRIGGNDLLHCLSLRRPKDRTIYDTPIGKLIGDLAREFIPAGFGLTAPVFELTCESFRPLLEEEIRQDLAHGLFGKTAIHPNQIPVIEAMYRVDEQDLEEARHIVKDDAPAVFKMGGRMCEPTTHSRWARRMIAQAEIYGTR
jgi:citrate lyase beta subunit